jgi:flagellar basal-body rod protein FlgB
MNLVPEFDPLFFSEAALRMRGYRQQILASNMANVDTPGYKSRDVLFSQALREQLEGTATPMPCLCPQRVIVITE